MRRVPLLATALVLIAIAVMIALGMWQLRRAAWKETLTARAAGNLLEATADLPAPLPPGLDYRRFRVRCERIEYLQPKAGTGQIGRAPCRERVCQYVEIPWVALALKKQKHT